MVRTQPLSSGATTVFESEILALYAKNKLFFKERRGWVLSREARQGVSYTAFLKFSSPCRIATLATSFSPGPFMWAAMTSPLSF